MTLSKKNAKIFSLTSTLEIRPSSYPMHTTRDEDHTYLENKQLLEVRTLSSATTCRVSFHHSPFLLGNWEGKGELMLLSLFLSTTGEAALSSALFLFPPSPDGRMSGTTDITLPPSTAITSTLAARQHDPNCPSSS